jgi:putative oxidoreductase
MSDVIFALGRVALTIVFITFGIIQFMNIGTYIANPAVAQVSTLTQGYLSPTMIAYAVATIDVVGGVLVLVGFLTRLAAAVLFIFVGLTIYFVHHFWDMEGAARAANMTNALKNLAMMGALLMLMVTGAGRLSIDGRSSASRDDIV